MRKNLLPLGMTSMLNNNKFNSPPHTHLLKNAFFRLHLLCMKFMPSLRFEINKFMLKISTIRWFVDSHFVLALFLCYHFMCSSTRTHTKFIHIWVAMALAQHEYGTAQCEQQKHSPCFVVGCILSSRLDNTSLQVKYHKIYIMCMLRVCTFILVSICFC